MPAGIEVHADGTAAFASANVSAWHKLGTVTAGLMTAEEALRTAYLARWNVRTLPLTTTELSETGVRAIEVPGHFATVRTNPKTGSTEPLGVVGRQYTPFQNEDAADFLNVLADEAGAVFETAGSLYGGRQVFLTMRLPEAMMVGGTDAHVLYIVALNSHDGSGAYRVIVTPVRVVCANTARAAIGNAVSSFSIRHTQNGLSRVAEARKALDLTWAYCEKFEKAAARMIEAEMSLIELESVVDALWTPPKGDSKRALKNRATRWAEISHLFTNATTQEAIRGTRWAGWTAITEYANHRAPSHGKTPEAKSVRRAERVASGELDALMSKAFQLTSV
ncbi:DUF932 domain-containing protein [Streptomyces koyangensis]|uniref:DUF932 domain-containing protein n=1 Tax=Streptomyces koyangensis TaxID=188770 RepID=UPI00337FFB5B